MNRTFAIIAAVLMILSGIAIASGAPGGASTTVGPTEQGTGTASTTQDLQGGNVTEVNVTGNQITGRWGGFYGSISGGIQLADSGSGLFYEWTVSDYTDAMVFVANSTVSDWASLAAATNANQPTYVQGVAADNWTNTFSTTEAFNSSSIGIADVPFTQTFDNTNTSTFKTYSLYAPTESAYVYAGKAINDATGFNGETVDYQVLAPADSGVVSYQFYLELP